MALNNSYRDYDKGMDDAYMGNERSNRGESYSRGYDYAEYLFEKERMDKEKKKMDKYYNKMMDNEQSQQENN